MIYRQTEMFGRSSVNALQIDLIRDDQINIARTSVPFVPISSVAACNSFNKSAHAAVARCSKSGYEAAISFLSSINRGGSGPNSGSDMDMI